MVFMPHWPIPHVKQNIMLGLDRIKGLLARLDNPHLKLPPVIHIAGTNGKGSITAYLKEIFSSSGYKVHRYISPHLIRFNERIELAGKEISDDYLYQIMEETRIAAEGFHTTFFEATTAAAFLAFSKVKADVVLLETGMGGAADATNVIDTPLLSIISPITFDHVEYLGDTIAKIAKEKAGIIKENCPTVVSWQMQEALDVLQAEALKKHSPFYACKLHWDFEVKSDGFTFYDFINKEELKMPQPSLFGLHQYMNASTVVAAMKFLTPHYKIKDIKEGISKAFWPARMQKITSGVLHAMLPPGFELWLDGAHNTGGAQMVAATIENKWNDKPIFIINGRTGDRDIKGFLMYFKGIAEAIYGVKVLSEPKGESAENIARGAIEIGMKGYACRDLKDAISKIISDSKTPCRILALGSLYLAGDILLANEG